jgi:hypothetical protein
MVSESPEPLAKVRRTTQRGIAAPKNMNLNSRTHERITVKINYEKETAFL